MKNSTAHKLRQVPPRYLIIGIDSHKKIHATAVMTRDTTMHTRFKFVNSKQGYEKVIKKARVQRVRTDSRGIIFAIETGVTIGETWLTFWMNKVSLFA